MNRKRKHPLEAQSDNDWACGLFIILACLLCAFLISLPTMSRARFNAPHELEREPVKNNQARLDIAVEYETEQKLKKGFPCESGEAKKH